jgi:hypothetical protein
VKPSTPRSLRAFPVQLNHGAVLMERKMTENPTMGANIPKYPKSLTSLAFTVSHRYPVSTG